MKIIINIRLVMLLFLFISGSLFAQDNSSDSTVESKYNQLAEIARGNNNLLSCIYKYSCITAFKDSTKASTFKQHIIDKGNVISNEIAADLRSGYDSDAIMNYTALITFALRVNLELVSLKDSEDINCDVKFARNSSSAVGFNKVQKYLSIIETGGSSDVDYIVMGECDESI